MKKCNTCNTAVSSEYVEFKCPDCGGETIIRCEHCRQTAKKYTCTKCGFIGP
jgi:Zn-ribbon RNA-binding protein